MNGKENKQKNKLNANQEICPKGSKNCPIFNEISLLRTEVEQLRAQVITDYLTGLFNVRHLAFNLEQEFERTHRSRQPTTMILLDIDHFKKVNDNYGHTAGDIVLKKIASILKMCVRKLDVCCRYGGEEFAVILPSTHQLVGAQVAERIRKRIEETVINLTEGDISVTASFGVDTFHYNTDETLKDFIARVDKQLYRAKKLGRNTVCSSPQIQSERSQVSADEKASLFDKPDSAK